MSQEKSRFKEALKNVKYRIKRITRRARRVPGTQIMEELDTSLKGWRDYYRLIEAAYVLEELDWWIRRSMQCFVMNQWIMGYSTQVSMSIVRSGLHPRERQRGEYF